MLGQGLQPVTKPPSGATGLVSSSMHIREGKNLNPSRVDIAAKTKEFSIQAKVD
jgi:hypothetical protein